MDAPRYASPPAMGQRSTQSITTTGTSAIASLKWGGSSAGRGGGALPRERRCPSTYNSPSRRLISASRTTMKRHGWRLLPLGARVAASIMRSTAPSGNGSGL